MAHIEKAIVYSVFSISTRDINIQFITSRPAATASSNIESRIAIYYKFILLHLLSIVPILKTATTTNRHENVMKCSNASLLSVCILYV